MIFTTAQFVGFFLVFFGVFAVLRGRARKWALLVGSYVFYASWDPRFLLLLMGSTVLDYSIAILLVRKGASVKRQRRLVASSAVGNLGALGLFKYYDFFAESAVRWLGHFGVDASLPAIRLVLPVGISFYTFQTLGYTIDVYRGKTRPATSLLDFANYVAFFPQLVAGPIERAKHLLPQLENIGRAGGRSDLSGWGMLAIGAFKKVVIADNMAVLVDSTYADPGLVYGPALWIGTYAFAVQIYCDFSGYSDIAVGLGRLLGIDIMQNFRAPYAATGPREFWRRWHISLSTWLRDYLYIPLGGNRHGRLRTSANLAITMLLGGLWHGAAWNFVLWGGYHGLLLMLVRIRGLSSVLQRVPAWGRRIVFFHLVCLGWALFRAESLEQCAIVLRRLVAVGSWDLRHFWSEVQLSGQERYLATMMVLAAMVIGMQMMHKRGTEPLVDRLWQTPMAVRVWVVTLLFFACVVFAPEQRPPFIYFQF